MIRIYNVDIENMFIQIGKYAYMHATMITYI